MGPHKNEENYQDDIERQNHLESMGILFLRFTNLQVEKNLETVTEKIEDYIKSNQK